MQTIARSNFTAVKTEGGLLPTNVLQRIADGRGLEGLRPDDYHLSGERVNEAISRSWNRCLGAWTAFRDARQKLAESDAGTTLTRERWLLVLFDVLGYGRLPTVRGVQIDDQSYPISHLWQNTPFYLISFRNDLDRRSEVGSGMRRSPHSVMQELLNRKQEYQWGIISNGLRLRLLRDNASLSRSAYVEFDTEAIMEGELYAEFSLLWLVCHQSRVENLRQSNSELEGAGADLEVDEVDDETEGEATQAVGPNASGFDCWLERWSKIAVEQGTRALDTLRQGVQEAIEALGSGFLTHPTNHAFRSTLQSGQLTTQGYYQQVRRLVYRLLFLLVAEDREQLLLPEAQKTVLPGTGRTIAQQYKEFYSLGSIRQRAERSRGGPHPDLYQRLRRLFVLLRAGYAPLGLPGLGSYLFSDRSTPDLDRLELANRDLLKAIFALSFTVESGVRRAVDYRNLDTEELGSVYESLLELHPHLEIGSGLFRLVNVASSERKTTGSYYTPTALVNELLNSALEPVVADRLQQAEVRWRKEDGRSQHQRQAMKEEALLSIKVLDFACGSGHMLIGAARRLALHLARIRSGDDEPGPEPIRHALRDVVRHCIYGVDLNATSVELCKVALWMETLEPGKPLGFLDANIRCGNSLLGVTSLAELETGIPDEAFSPKSGDDKATVTALRRRNKREREGQLRLQYQVNVIDNVEDLARWRVEQISQLVQINEDEVAAIERKTAAFSAYLTSDEVVIDKLKADLWTAAFFWPVNAGNADRLLAPTDGVLQEISRGLTPDPGLVQGVQQLAERHNFFHWFLEFPNVDQQGGFDVILSNPPWEMLEFSETEFFGTLVPEIAMAPTARQRSKLIADLQTGSPSLYQDYLDARRDVFAARHFIQSSNRFPLSSQGRINLYPLFSELALSQVVEDGNAGIIVPSAISTDAYNADLFSDIIRENRLVSLYDFENSKGVFPAVHRSYRFCLLTICGQAVNPSQISFVYFCREVAELALPQRRVVLSKEELELFSPNTLAPPILQNDIDFRLAKAVYGRFGVLIDKTSQTNSWSVSIQRMLSLSDPGDMFRSATELGEATESASQWSRVYSGKTIHQFNHRFATYDSKKWLVLNSSTLSDPRKAVSTEYYVKKDEVNKRIAEKQPVKWLIGYRDICRATDERTAIASIIPRVGCDTHCRNIYSSIHPVFQLSYLIGNLNSFAFDFFARQKVISTGLGSGLLEQLPILPPQVYIDVSCFSHDKTWMISRLIELTYTAWDLQSFAQDCGYEGPPFLWDEGRRFLLRCELDAAYFHLYCIARDDVDYIMETFPIVKRKDVTKHDEYRTKRVILEIYDEMAEAMRTGDPYQTRLDPPPADPRVAHPPRVNADLRSS